MTARDLLRAARARAGDEHGITIIEVVVAALVLTVGGLGLLAMSDAATRNTYRAEQSQVIVNRLQGEVERIRQLPFREVALTAAPPTSSDPSNPASRVAGSQFALERDGTSPAPLAINGGTTPTGKTVTGGAIAPGPEPFTSGDVSGEIYRYVVYPGPPLNCTGCSADNLKRVIVAITLNDTASGGDRTYQEVQSEVANPDATPPDNPVPPPPPGGEEHVATFWLTDTPCNNTTRQAPPASPGDSHATHNTRGVCADGVKLDNTPGAPDLMFNAPPPGDEANPEPLSDYATDVEPLTNPGSDIGLTTRRPSSSLSTGCLLTAPPLDTLDFPALSVEESKRQKMHMWLSNQLTADLRLLTSATATLNLRTKTINGQPYGGKICIWVFKRATALSLLGQTLTVDVPAINTTPPLVNATHFVYEDATWPQEWTEIQVPMNMIWATNALAGLNIVGQPRLGLAITVERNGTTCPGDESSCGLEFMYDRQGFDSRLEVQNDQGLVLLP